jgi:hypothetical protein
MHKKLAADLTSLAHSILQMKNKEDVFALKSKAYEVYEKLAVLAYIEEYINNTPNPEHSKEELIALVENVKENIEKLAIEEKEEIVSEAIDTPIEEVTENLKTEEDVVKHHLEDINTETLNEEVAEEELEEVKEELEEEIALISEESLIDFSTELEQEELFTEPEELVQELTEEEKVDENLHTLEEELKDTIAVDVVADLFENAPKKSLNDKLQGDIQIGLNDRIAFVKNLFGGSQEDFNRVVSQLNTFKTEKEAKKFINKMVKPDYDWTDKEELEERFMTIVERKFV